jgi:hypothetical protein
MEFESSYLDLKYNLRQENFQEYSGFSKKNYMLILLILNIFLHIYLFRKKIMYIQRKFVFMILPYLWQLDLLPNILLMRDFWGILSSKNILFTFPLLS